MYNINDKIVPNSEKIREPIEEVRYTPENIWDNMPPEPDPNSVISDEEFNEKYLKWFNERQKRQKIIDNSKVERLVTGTVVTDVIDFYGKHVFYATIPEVLKKEYEDECYYVYSLSDKENAYINSLDKNSLLIDFLSNKFPFDIKDK